MTRFASQQSVQVGGLVILVALSFALNGACARAADTVFEAPGTLGTTWYCWYVASEFQLQCQLITPPAGGFSTPDRAAAGARQRESVDDSWSHPDSLSAPRATIPLWNPPIEMDSARRLARAVMCGQVRPCTVDFDENRDRLAPLRAEVRRYAAETRTTQASVVP